MQVNYRKLIMPAEKKIIQNNQNGDNNISFEIKGSVNDLSKNKTINSFKNSNEIRKFYKNQGRKKIIAYIIAILQFFLAPVYGYIVIKYLSN